MTSKNLSVLESARGLIEFSEYDLKSIRIETAEFHLLGRKAGGFSVTELEQSILKLWPLISDRFYSKPKEAAIIDFDAPLGGGPLMPYVVGIFSSRKVSSEHQTLVQQSTDWLPQVSTSEYINQHYASFSNPRQAYLDDMLVHELGHLFFGWGLTGVELSIPNNWWFAFGMGLLYDRLAWDHLYKSASPLFSQVIGKWKSEFAKQKNIDQRLINPDTRKDQLFELQRMQTYGHGKSYEFLKSLRERIGFKIFDEVTNSFLKTQKSANYDVFCSLFKSQELSKISQVEREFQVR